MGGKPRPKKYRMVMLNFGYVESGSISNVFFIHMENYFESKEKALAHLAHSLFEVYLSKLDYHINGWKAACCKKAAEDKNNDFCPKCRTQLRHDYDFELFEQWVGDLYRMTANDLPDMSQHMNWWPWLTWEEIAKFADQCFEVEDSAGSVITGMLNPDWFDEQAQQESSIVHKLGAEVIKKAYAEWSNDRDFDYLKSKYARP